MYLGITRASGVVLRNLIGCIRFLTWFACFGSLLRLASMVNYTYLHSVLHCFEYFLVLYKSLLYCLQFEWGIWILLLVVGLAYEYELWDFDLNSSVFV